MNQGIQIRENQVHIYVTAVFTETGAIHKIGAHFDTICLIIPHLVIE